ncbi:MAG: hypothetical protein FGM15_04165 [Chthoniobacterales bacterium]|nr:hypothetical protein [Chthoniobacterales bacterium]
MKHVLTIVLLGLAGCATLQQPQVDPKILNEFTSRGVSDAIVFQVREGLPLSTGQVAECVRKGVPGPGLVSYMQSTRKAYNLSNADIANLRSAGAPAPLINYMRRSYDYYTKGPKAVDQGHPYFATQNYSRYGGLRAPFAYAPPQADTFFDSAYEDELYSPFSYE